MIEKDETKKRRGKRERERIGWKDKWEKVIEREKARERERERQRQRDRVGKWDTVRVF